MRSHQRNLEIAEHNPHQRDIRQPELNVLFTRIIGFRRRIFVIGLIEPSTQATALISAVMTITRSNHTLINTVIATPLLDRHQLIGCHGPETPAVDKRCMGQIHECLQHAQPMGLPNHGSLQGTPSTVV